MTKYLTTALLVLLLFGCSRGKLSYYKAGDLNSRSFEGFTTQRKQLKGDYYEVRRNRRQQIISAKHFTYDRALIEKSYYRYSNANQLKGHELTEYFQGGPPRMTRDWEYEDGRIVKREEQWFTRSRTRDKKLTISYDQQGKQYLEETWGSGNKIESTTEYYYDYNHLLDKSRRNFYLDDESLRDYWLTIYNDQVQIMTEEHYLPDNSLVTFYRYTYHPVKNYREREEILDADRNVFILRDFDEFGLVLLEEESDREMNLLKRTTYEYDDKHRPKLIHVYKAADKRTSTKKYQRPRYLEAFRTPGI